MSLFIMLSTILAFFQCNSNYMKEFACCVSNDIFLNDPNHTLSNFSFVHRTLKSSWAIYNDLTRQLPIANKVFFFL